MFYDCRALKYIKMLATDISASSCLSDWVGSVASSGTFVKNADATWNVTGSSGIPSGWTVVYDGGANLITFTIGEIEYQAEEGMTWGEWVDSEYSQGKFGIDVDNSIGSKEIFDSIFVEWVGNDVSYVYASDVIQEGYAYSLVT